MKGDLYLSLPKDIYYWDLKIYKFKPPYGDSDSSSVENPKINELKIQSKEAEVSRRYILEFKPGIKFIKEMLKVYESVGLHVELDADIQPYANALISIWSEERVKIYDYSSNGWFDYQIQEDGSECDKKQCRGGDEENSKYRKRTNPVSIGAIHDMDIFKGHNLKLQFLLEVEAGAKLSSFEIKDVQFHFYEKTKAQLEKDINSYNKSKAEVSDNGQSGPRPPRNQ